MIKKLSLVLIALCLTSCVQKEKTIEEKLVEIGYTENQISAILNLSSDNQEAFFSEYNNDIALVMHEGFKEENLSKYKAYLGIFDMNITYYLVNNNIINENNIDLIKEILNDDYCILENIPLYMNVISLYSTLSSNRIRKSIEVVNCKSYIKQYTEYELVDTSKGNLMLVNKYHCLSDDYVPDNLIKIDEQYCYKNCYMDQEAYNAYLLMILSARAEGLDFFITSAYRSYETQQKVHNEYLAKDSIEKVDSYSARPGFSEHQTGLAVDILKQGYNFQNFGETAEAKWLSENAYKYGFILRYPSDKTGITGYVNETWHFRYVGVDVAKYIHDTGITFDEYYAYFIEK